MSLDTLKTLQRRLEQFATDPSAIKSDSKGHPVFLSFLTDTCDLVRSHDAQDPDFGDVVSKANDVINQGIKLAYGKLELFDFLPSFAHSPEFPVLLGPERGENVFSHRLSGILDLMKQWVARGDMKEPDPSLLPKFPEPWHTTRRPHPLSSLLSRFEGDAATHEPTTPLRNVIYDARCEITSDSAYQPTSLMNNGSCLMMAGMGGYKNRSPMLTYYLLDDDAAPRRSQFPLKERQAKVGLTELAWTSATDESKKLMFVADKWRVKSYAWADENTGAIYDKALPTHTLYTNHEGPLHVLSPGCILRAGKGSIDVWNLAALKTHGPDGRKRIGRKFNTSDSWRDEDDELEESSGSKPTSSISLADPKLAPGRWHAHPSAAATMLCGTDTDKSNDYSCVSLDLEHGGKTLARYLGHGGEIRAFSTSSADPNIFLTAASDGHARLYDHRVPLPVLSLQAGSGEDDCAGVVLVHPDGVPTVFTGASNDQVIRLWDVRAQKMVYELSTGNNAVMGMTWDAPRSVLYVATACDYMDRNGETYDYRRAKVPRPPRDSTTLHGEEDEDDSMDDDDYDSEDEDDDDEAPCWPQKAAYAEDYFGHLFDAGEHRLFRYAFKDQADPSILPEYGRATVDREPSW
ncbi:hypothetical protein K438DRAFT_1720617 [Mycena galopus ATCC 62051]|nr:hypothetical protein K438DRAFT_1720617 [Mycena galopus ATCC 62051]